MPLISGIALLWCGLVYSFEAGNKENGTHLRVKVKGKAIPV
jgi:hypothetical protein